MIVGKNAILYLQKIQDEHDRIAHQEVVFLEKDKRLNHYVLHFFKYASNLCDLNEKSDNSLINDKEYKKQLRDTFLLTLAIANTYNVELVSNIIDSDFRNILKNIYSEKVKDNQDLIDFTYKSILKNGSKMAKTIESIDHLEPISIENNILFYNKCLFSDILIPMSVLQEENGIYWEKEIILTHALIKMKKPWVRAKCQNEFSKIDYKFIIPLLDGDNNVENLVTHIDLFVDERNKKSSYNSDIELKLNNEELKLNNFVINKDFYNLQLLQNKRENTYVGVSELKENNIKKHLEKNLFKLTNRIRDIYLLQKENENNDLKLIDNDILNKFLESFEIVLSISSKLNQNIDLFLKDCGNIEEKSLKEVFLTIYQGSKFKNNINFEFDKALMLIGNISQILIHLDLLEDRDNPISKKILLGLDEITHFLCSFAGFMEEKYNLDVTNELTKHLIGNKLILGEKKLKF